MRRGFYTNGWICPLWGRVGILNQRCFISEGQQKQMEDAWTPDGLSRAKVGFMGTEISDRPVDPHNLHSKVHTVSQGKGSERTSTASQLKQGSESLNKSENVRRFTSETPKDKSTRVETSREKNKFLEKLSEMEKSATSSAIESGNTSESRKQSRAKKILEERKSMLVFRDVGMDLDKPILSRDVFLVFKYFRYGIEFAVDNELERMLRYFNEHALNELKIIQSSKLMRGPATLFRKKARVNSMISQIQLIPSFPSFEAANVRQYCRFSADIEKKAAHLLHIGGSRPFCGPFLTSKDTCSKKKNTISFNSNDLTQRTSFLPSAFRRPTVLLYTQLGQKLGAQADSEWRRLAYSTIFPQVLQYIPKMDASGEGHVASALEQHLGGLRGRPTDASSLKSMPIDVISLRSMDVYKYHWVHRLYVRRFAQSLMTSSSQFENKEDALVSGLLTASTTFVGCRLLEPFSSILGLRNYLSPHIMLIDHEGMIRWLSAGCPDDFEREHFPALLRQLENEYYYAVGGKR